MTEQPSRPNEAVAAGALLGTFAGDAIGAGFEGSPSMTARDGSERTTQALARGKLSYTDDTQLALALAEHLCDSPEVEPHALARVFLDHYEPGRGYGAGMHRLIDLWRRGVSIEQAATAVFPQGSFGNGAAMRIAPVGVVWAHDRARLVEVARRSSRLTHAHPYGVDGAVVQAMAVALGAARGRFGRAELEEVAAQAETDALRAGLRAALQQHDDWYHDADLTLAAVARELGNEVIAHRSVPAALWAAATARSFPDGVGLAVGLGGDADTLAAMTAAVLGAAGTQTVIPDEWLYAFEDGARGRSYARALARRLAEVTGRLTA